MLLRRWLLYGVELVWLINAIYSLCPSQGGSHGNNGPFMAMQVTGSECRHEEVPTDEAQVRVFRCYCFCICYLAYVLGDGYCCLHFREGYCLCHYKLHIYYISSLCMPFISFQIFDRLLKVYSCERNENTGVWEPGTFRAADTSLAFRLWQDGARASAGRITPRTDVSEVSVRVGHMLPLRVLCR